MKAIARKYLDFLRQRDVARLTAVALVARMPIGMVGFSMLMYLREALGNYALAGSAVGIHFVAIAVSAPVLGRLIDRLGPKRPLLVTGAMHPLALLAVFFAARHALPFPLVALCAAIAGAFSSPITVLTRTVWRHRFEREEDRRTAFSLDAVTIEINFTVGPALIAAILAAWGSGRAFLVAIAFVVVAVIVFLASPALRYFKPEAGVERHLLGPLTERRLWLLFICSFGLTTAFGLLEVGYPAYATSLAIPAFGGVLLAINSLGSATGGSIFGGLHLKAPIERQFSTALGLMALPLLLHAIVTPTWLFAIVAFLAGALIAPSIASQAVLVSRFAPSHYATEAFTWSTTFIVSGLGAGMALGGALVESVGVRYAFAFASAVVLAMSLLSLALSGATVTAPRRGTRAGT
ncbi:MAG: MFS transporter [Bacillota bacterium]